MVMGFKFTGDRARAGASGPPGVDGESAYQIALNNGFVGSEAQWLASLVGPEGDIGPPGPASTVPGPPGTPGTDGSAATITVGTTTTGTPTTPASVTNVGTSNAAVLNFVIPKGDKGDQGAPGISKRIVTLSGTTDASGNVAFTFSPAFAATPHVAVMLVTTNTRQYVRITAASATGCTINAYQQNQTLLSLLGLDILTAGVTAMASATIRIMATEM